MADPDLSWLDNAPTVEEDEGGSIVDFLDAAPELEEPANTVGPLADGYAFAPDPEGGLPTPATHQAERFTGKDAEVAEAVAAADPSKVKGRVITLSPIEIEGDPEADPSRGFEQAPEDIHVQKHELVDYTPGRLDVPMRPLVRAANTLAPGLGSAGMAAGRTGKAIIDYAKAKFGAGPDMSAEDLGARIADNYTEAVTGTEPETVNSDSFSVTPLVALGDVNPFMAEGIGAASDPLGAIKSATGFDDPTETSDYERVRDNYRGVSEQAYQENPWTYGTVRAAGTLATGAAIGGAMGAAEGTQMGAQAADKIAKARNMGKAGSALMRYAGRIVGGAAEGGVLGAVEGAGRAGDDARADETTGEGALVGGLTGAAVGGAVPAITGAARGTWRAVRGAPDKAQSLMRGAYRKAGAGRSIGDLEAIADAVRSTDAERYMARADDLDAEAAVHELRQTLGNAGALANQSAYRRLLGEGPNQGRRAQEIGDVVRQFDIEGASDIRLTETKMRDYIGSLFGELDEMATATAEQGARGVGPARAVDMETAAAKVRALASKLPEGRASARAAYERVAQQLEKLGKVSFEKARHERSAYRDPGAWIPDAMSTFKPGQKDKQAIYRAINEEIYGAARDIDPTLGERVRLANQAESFLIGVREMADKASGAGAVNDKIGLTGTISIGAGGALGGYPGAVAAYALNRLKGATQHDIAALFRRKQARQFETLAERLQRDPNFRQKYTPLLESLARRTGSLGAANYILSNENPDYAREQATEGNDQ